MKLKIALLQGVHNREDFDCGNELLNNYLRLRARQDIRRKLSVCFVLIDADKAVKGYYTLSNAGIPKDHIPDEIKRKLPDSYTELPVTLLGRLAVDKSAAGQGYGEFLLTDALKRCCDVAKNEIGSAAVVVDPVDESAVGFYKKYGFIVLPDSGKMFLSMKTVSQVFD